MKQSSYLPHVRHLDTAGTLAIDVVGDIHGCFDELHQLLETAGYRLDGFDPSGSEPIGISHPEGRRLVFLGDLTDRGPRSDLVLRLAMGGRSQGCIDILMGNHDWKLYRYLLGRKVTVANGLAGTLEQIELLGDSFKDAVRALYEDAPHQIRIPLSGDPRFGAASNLWLVHAAAKAHRQGKTDRDSFERSVYGYADGNLDEAGGLQRHDWAASYEGIDPVIHGHVVHRDPTEKNRVLCLDTGCVFGNKLTLQRLDSGEFLSVEARANHSGKEKVFL